MELLENEWDKAPYLCKLIETLSFISSTLEQYDKCDIFYSWENETPEEIQGVESALRNYEFLTILIENAEELAAMFPDKELSKKTTALLHAIVEKLYHTDLDAEHAVKRNENKKAINLIKEAFKRVYLSINTNLSILIGEIAVFTKEYVNNKQSTAGEVRDPASKIELRFERDRVLLSRMKTLEDFVWKLDGVLCRWTIFGNKKDREEAKDATGRMLEVIRDRISLHRQFFLEKTGIELPMTPSDYVGVRDWMASANLALVKVDTRETPKVDTGQENAKIEDKTPSEEPAETEQEIKPVEEPLQPLTQKAKLIYEKLNTLQPYEAMTLPKIQDWLYSTHRIDLDEGTWKNIRKELIPYGLKNRPRVGYDIEKK